MYTLYLSASAKKSLKKLKSNKKFDRDNFNNVLDILLRGEKLEKKYKNHILIGNYASCQECHVQNDLLLIYHYLDDKLILYIVNVGSHSELF